MNPDQITAIAAAVVAIIGAVTAFVKAMRRLGEILAELRGNRKELEKNTKVTEESHVMINSQREAAIEQQTKTDNLLRAAGIPLPANPAAATQVTGTGGSDAEQAAYGRGRDDEAAGADYPHPYIENPVGKPVKITDVGSGS